MSLFMKCLGAAAARRAGLIFLASAIIWLVLTGAAAAHLLAGILVAGSAAVVAAVGMPGRGPDRTGQERRVPLILLRGLLWLPGFLWRAFVGAFDVAWRVLNPRLPIAPHFVDMPTTMPEGPARAVYTGAISLTPGSLGAGSFGDHVRVHLLSDDEGLAQGVRDEETRLRHVTALDRPL